MVNIALPTIARELHVTAADAVWIVNSFQFAVTFALIPVAGLADIVGYLNVYMAGLALVAVAALAAGTARSLLPLALARIVHGLGAACLTTASDALNRAVFPRAMLGRATGIAATAVAIGVLAGPVVGGAILSVAPWPAIFWINVPFAIVMLAVAPRVFPRDRGAGGRFDGRSAALGALALGAFVVALGGGGHGQPLPLVLGELAVALVVGWLFVRRQLGLPAPVIAIDLFAQPVFLLSFIASVAAFIAQTLAYVALPFLFQTIFERSVFESGLLTIPWLIATGVTSPLAGHLPPHDASLLGGPARRLRDRSRVAGNAAAAPPRRYRGAGRLRVHHGFFQAPNNRVIPGATPRERSAAASGIDRGPADRSDRRCMLRRWRYRQRYRGGTAHRAEPRRDDLFDRRGGAAGRRASAWPPRPAAISALATFGGGLTRRGLLFGRFFAVDFWWGEFFAADFCSAALRCSDCFLERRRRKAQNLSSPEPSRPARLRIASDARGPVADPELPNGGVRPCRQLSTAVIFEYA